MKPNSGFQQAKGFATFFERQPSRTLTTVLLVGAFSVTGAAAATFKGSKAGDDVKSLASGFAGVRPASSSWAARGANRERRPGEDQVEVTLTKGFWMGKFEATQGQWKRVMGKLPGELTAELPEGDDFPVGNVNFAEAEAFCQKLTELARQSGELPKDWEFRLPTEAQWEYACRAGTTTATSFGDKLSSKQANFKGKPYNGGRAGAIAQSGRKSRQLSRQRVGTARHARQHLRVVPGLVPSEVAGRRRSRFVLRATASSRRPARWRLGRRRLALPVRLSTAVRAGAALRPHRLSDCYCASGSSKSKMTLPPSRSLLKYWQGPRC